MNALEVVFRWILDVSWQASVLAAAVLLAQFVFRPWLNPRWKHALWLLVLLRLVLPVTPESPVSGYVWAPTPFLQAEPLTERNNVTSGTPSLVAEKKPDPLDRKSQLSIIQKLCLVWIAGVVIGGIWVLAVNLNFMFRTRRLCKGVDDNILCVYEKACKLMGIRWAPRLILTGRVSSPALMGFFQPVILLSEKTHLEFSDEELRLIFLHELAHFKRGDHLIQWLVTLLSVLHWFNPLLWLAFRRIRMDREPAADALVLSNAGESYIEPYGLVLLRMVEHLQLVRSSPVLVGILEDKEQLKHRFSLISLFNRKAYAWSVLSVLLIGILGLFFLTRQKKEVSVAFVGNLAPEILKAAKSGDGPGIMSLITKSMESSVSIDETQAGEMIESLLVKRDIQSFRTLLEQMRQTNLGKDWQPNDDMLAGLIRDERRDFLEILMLDTAKPLELKRLTSLQSKASPDMSEWITKRTVEVIKQKEDENALAQAAKKGDLETMRRLIAAGVNVNCVARNHHTPLTNAAWSGNTAAARLLLENGAKVDMPKHPGWDYTPLCLAKNVEMAILLKEYGANVHAKLFKRDVSILTYVARWQGPELVSWFLDQGLDPHKIGDNNETLLFDAGNGKTMELLLEAGLDPNHVNEFGHTAIVGARDAESVRALIKHGAKLTGFKHPLLPQMIQSSTVSAIEEVLKAGVENDHKTIQQALISASHMDKSDIARLLIKYGAKPDEEVGYSSDEHKLTALHACSIWGSPKTTKVLLEHGANPNGGKDPINYLRNALNNGYPEVAKLLREAGATGITDLEFSIVLREKAKVVEMLRTAPNFKNNSGFWSGAMTSAARIGDLETVQACLDKNVPVNDKTGKGESPYTASASEGQHEVLELLLSKRPNDFDPSDLDYALWIAVWNSHPYPEQRTSEHFEQTVKILLEAGASTNALKNRSELMQSAVFTRYPGGNPRVVKMLVEAGANPNPSINGKGKLTDIIQKSCNEKGCSTPSAATLAAVESATKVKFKISQK